MMLQSSPATNGKVSLVLLQIFSWSVLLTSVPLATAFSSSGRQIPRKCFVEPVAFKFNETVPYSHEEQKHGKKPFEFGEHCPETQECLGLRDDTLWNLRAAALGTSFPIFENNLLPELSPETGHSIIENAHVLFDDESTMHIQGVGTYKGAIGIGGYTAIPHNVVSGIVKNADLSKTMKVIERNRMVTKNEWLQEWAHKQNESHVTDVRLEITFYTCSVKIRSIIMELSDFTLDSFTEAAHVPGAKEQVCRDIMDNCVGEYQQYDDLHDCIDYMNALPDFDPICQHKVGPKAVQGNSYMCKYLHHFMAPFEPHLHCFHAGKGRVDMSGKRKCAPTDCLDDDTPAELLPELLAPSDSKETFFRVNENGTFSETLVAGSEGNVKDAMQQEQHPAILEHKRKFVHQDDDTCHTNEAAELAAATVLTLPFCMSSLNHGTCHANCTQAVQTYLGRFVENGAVCRCSKGVGTNDVRHQSAMLTKLRVDPKVLIEFCSNQLSAMDYPDCLGESTSLPCPVLGTYRGAGACLEWDYPGVEQAVLRDWGKEAQFLGRRTQSDLVASAECSVLSIWSKFAKSDEHYYTRYSGSNLPTLSLVDGTDHGYKIHPSMDELKVGHQDIVAALAMNQVRDPTSMVSETCYFGSMKELHMIVQDAAQTAVNGPTKTAQSHLYQPVAYSTGSQLHRLTRDFVETAFPGLWGAPEPGHTYTEILDRVIELRNVTRDDLRNNLVKEDIESVIREVLFRALFEDELPYIDDKLGNDLDNLNVGLLFRPKGILMLQGGFLPTSFVTAKDQIRRFLQNSGVLTSDRMQEILEHVGLDDYLGTDGKGDAFDLLVFGLVATITTYTSFSSMIERVRWDECEVRPLWEEVGGKRFIMEHLRLNMDVPGFIATNPTSGKKQMHLLRTANVDPNVFEDPLTFNPKRKNLHQALFFNGLEKDYESHMDANGFVHESALKQAPGLRRWCHGRHLTLNLMEELAPLFFPPDTKEYHCHGGMRARYGVEFTSDIITIPTDGVELEVLKVDGKSEGENLMIMMGSNFDVPLGWSMFIANMRRQELSTTLDYWVVPFPGWGKGSKIEQYDVQVISDYIVDLIRHAKKSYDRIFFFGWGDAGALGYYVADKAGRQNLHGFITPAIHPAVAGQADSYKPATSFYNAPFLDPMADLFVASDEFPIENVFKNMTWWNQAWEWDFRSFQRKAGSRSLSEIVRAWFSIRPDGTLLFKDLDGASSLDPDTHILAVRDEFSAFNSRPDYLNGLARTSPKPGTVHRFKQLGGKPVVYEHLMTPGGDGEEFAHLVGSFVEQTVRIEYSLWSRLTVPFDTNESSYKDKANSGTLPFAIWIISFTIMITGILAELTIGKELVNKSFSFWIFAQVFSATLTLGCFFSTDPISIPLFTLGLFKFGYPEITHNLVAPIKHPEIYDNNKCWRAMAFLSGIANIVHHTGAAVVYVAIVFKDMSPLSLGMLALATLFQHLVVFLKYANANLYAVVMLGLEVWFQLESYYFFTFATPSPRIGIILLLASHYFWFLEGTFMLVKSCFANNKLSETNELHSFRTSSKASAFKEVRLPSDSNSLPTFIATDASSSSSGDS